jgi:lipoprotein-anchoring transpeptidase ErfK/SrfK
MSSGHRPAKSVAALLSVAAVALGIGALARPLAARSRGSTADPSPATEPQVSTPACAWPTLIGTVVIDQVTARQAPSPWAPPIASFGRVSPQGAPQVFDLGGSAEGSTGDLWVRALLPIRPNGTWGFVPETSLSLAEVPYRIVVDRERLTLTLWEGCTVLKVFPIGLGKESTPTPNGSFYITSLLRPPIPDSIYGPHAYGLSAFSDAITNWKGGGVIGIHGTNDPSSIGDRRSHGCIRMYNHDIEELVPFLPLGTPVEIR